jgi:hypothetical protein
LITGREWRGVSLNKQGKTIVFPNRPGKPPVPLGCSPSPLARPTISNANHNQKGEIILKQNQVNFTVTAAEKKQIEKLAEACGLSQGEYLRQRALGFEPKAFPPGEGYWRIHSDLLWLMNHAPSPEYNARYAAAFQRLRETYFLPEKQTPEEIRAELAGG